MYLPILKIRSFLTNNIPNGIIPIIINQYRRVPCYATFGSQGKLLASALLHILRMEMTIRLNIRGKPLKSEKVDL